MVYCKSVYLWFIVNHLKLYTFALLYASVLYNSVSSLLKIPIRKALNTRMMHLFSSKKGSVECWTLRACCFAYIAEKKAGLPGPSNYTG